MRECNYVHYSNQTLVLQLPDLRRECVDVHAFSLITEQQRAVPQTMSAAIARAKCISSFSAPLVPGQSEQNRLAKQDMHDENTVEQELTNTPQVACERRMATEQMTLYVACCWSATEGNKTSRHFDTSSTSITLCPLLLLLRYVFLWVSLA